jgi:hypothetical protein
MGTDAPGPNEAAAIRSAQEALERSYLTARAQMVDDQAAQAARDALRSFLDQTVSLGQSYLALWKDSAQATLRGAFHFQNASLQASGALLERVPAGDRHWLEQASEAARTGQDAAAEIVAATFAALASALPAAGRR